MDPAFEQLIASQRDIADRCQTSADGNTAGAIDMTYPAARKRRKTCEASKNWTTQYNGKTMSLRGDANKAPMLRDRLEGVRTSPSAQVQFKPSFHGLQIFGEEGAKPSDAHPRVRY